MTISELGSLGEVVGAFGLIVTLAFLAMEMRMTREDGIYRDLEHLMIRNQELCMLVTQSPELADVITKFNNLTGGHFQPLPKDVTAQKIRETFDERELTILTNYHYANSWGAELFLTKAERGAISEDSMRMYDLGLRETTKYLTVLGNVTIPRRIKERYLTENM